MSDDLHIGPSVLAPGAPSRGDWLARLIVWPLLVLLMLITIVFYVWYSPLQVSGDSMEPSLSNGDRALRTKSYEEPARGDVVVLSLAAGLNDDDDIVKRVVAVAGDTVQIADDLAWVNGKAEEPGRVLISPGEGMSQGPLVVPDGSVYVLGDNRPVSLDSRSVGVIPVDQIRGRVAFRFLPLNRVGTIE